MLNNIYIKGPYIKKDINKQYNFNNFNNVNNF